MRNRGKILIYFKNDLTTNIEVLMHEKTQSLFFCFLINLFYANYWII
jgi:hypothetical protein